MECWGNETSLAACPSAVWEPNFYCQHREDARYGVLGQRDQPGCLSVCRLGAKLLLPAPGRCEVWSAGATRPAWLPVRLPFGSQTSIASTGKMRGMECWGNETSLAACPSAVWEPNFYC